MIIEINQKTPTINHLYFHRGNQKILKSDARKLRDHIIDIVSNVHRADPCELVDKPLEVVIHIFEDWYYKNGNVRKADLGNREKFLIDSVFKALDIDDKWIFRLVMKKVQSTEERTTIQISPYHSVLS